MPSAPDIEALSLEDTQPASQTSCQAQGPLNVNHENLEVERSPNESVRDYLMNNVEEFRRLQELRQKGWESAEGDNHFKKQREVADTASEKSSRFFYTMMQTIAKDLNKATGALNLAGIRDPALLDMCMAPGGFIDKVLTHKPFVRVRAMSLPVESGGHEVRLVNKGVNVEFRDVTTLAADMGITKDDVPEDFPESHDFLFTKLFKENEKFDLVFCDGAVLRTHQRPEWRGHRDPFRLALVQLTLGLEHLNSGGTMVMLEHKLDSWRCFDLIHQFSKFSTVQLFKHHRNHRIRSSFYLVAKNIQADSAFAKDMVQSWKQRYKIATFGTDEEYAKMHQVTSKVLQEGLEEFGEKFIAMGRNIWKIQADGLETASFMKHDPDEKVGKADDQ